MPQLGDWARVGGCRIEVVLAVLIDRLSALGVDVLGIDQARRETIDAFERMRPGWTLLIFDDADRDVLVNKLDATHRAHPELTADPPDVAQTVTAAAPVSGAVAQTLAMFRDQLARVTAPTLLLVATRGASAQEGSFGEDLAGTALFRRAGTAGVEAAAASFVLVVVAVTFQGWVGGTLFGVANLVAAAGIWLSSFALKRHMGRRWLTISALVISSIVVAPIVLGFAFAALTHH